MSTYTIGEIVVWLLLAAGLGFVLGWVARELRLRRGDGVPAAIPPAPQSEPVEEPPAADQAPAKKAAVKAPATKPAATKAPAKAAAKKAPAKKAAATKAPAKKTAA